MQVLMQLETSIFIFLKNLAIFVAANFDYPESVAFIVSLARIKSHNNNKNVWENVAELKRISFERISTFPLVIREKYNGAQKS